MKKAGALRSGCFTLLFHDPKKSWNDFVLEPFICGGSVKVDDRANVRPLTPPYQAAYGNLRVIRREPCKSDCIAQFRLGQPL